MKKELIILFLVLAFTKLFSSYSLKEIPLGLVSEIQWEQKTETNLTVKTDLPRAIFNIEEFTTRIISEFDSTKSDVIYVSKLIAVPEGENLEIKVIKVDSIVVPLINKNILPVRGVNSQSQLPLVYLGKEGKLRGVKVVPLNIRQYRYLPEQHTLVCYNNIEVEIKSQNSFSSIFSTYNISKEWAEFYNSVVINYEEPTQNQLISMPGYIIIVADELYNGILPLARWKEKKGFKVTIKRISEIGSGSSAIRNYLIQAYQTFTPKPEYVLLVGNANAIPPIPGGQSVGDHLYACLDGDDLYPDIFVGRFPASNTSELSIMVNKTLSYEQNPYTGDTLWYKRALMVATSYQQSGVPVWTALAIKRALRELLLNSGFIRVDTCFYPPNTSGVGIIDTIINRGVAFVNGRGWGNREGWTYPYFKINEVYNLNNTGKLPIVTSFYCATGNYTATTNFGTAWLIAGTPQNLKGGVAFYGPVYSTTSTRFNNCQDFSIYWSIFRHGITRLGPALFAGKISLLNNFPLSNDSVALVTHVITYNLLGDPSLDMWTGEVPQQLTVNYSNQLPVGSTALTATVFNSSAQPVNGALVSLYNRNEIQVSAYTNKNGVAVLNFLAQTSDTLFVTVTKHNFIPHQGFVLVVSPNINVGYYSHNGSLNAGSINNITITLKNYGNNTMANNVTAILRSNDNYVTIIDSVRHYGTIPPGTTAISSPYQVYVNSNAPNNYQPSFNLAIAGDNFQGASNFLIPISSAELIYKSYFINDYGNNILEPNENAEIIIKVYNRGTRNLQNVVAYLRSANPYAIIVTDSFGYYGTINIGDTVENTQETFRILAAPNVAIGRKFYLRLALLANNFEQTLEFPIVIGPINSQAPTGPDGYGYWAYDNTDIQYDECPVYNWIEIDPNYGGSGTRINLTHYGIATINLPFNFKYYGQNYNQISVTALGYTTMGSNTIVDPYNWSILSPVGPPALIAVFWDDFHPETLSSSGVYYYYDHSNHRFIVQWSRIHHIHGFRNPYPAEQQTFQVIFCDPLYYPTITGDGVIIFQYHTVFNDDSAALDCHNFATVGIESANHNHGIEYTFANRYPSTAAIVQPGRAIKFTTNPPDTFTAFTEMESYPITNSISLKGFYDYNRKTISLSYWLTKSSKVSVSIYDVIGRQITTINYSQNQNPGKYRVNLPIVKRLKPGVYFVVLNVSSNEGVSIDKIKLIVN
jgi:hypothetical protein